MNKLKFNPNNAKYYSDDFIKGFECGVERQFNVDMAEKTAEWIIVEKQKPKEYEEAIKKLKSFCHNCSEYPQCVNTDRECFEALDMAIEALSADNTAEWRIVGKTTLHYECSKCGGAGDEWDKFCKHCGARMRKESEDEK